MADFMYLWSLKVLCSVGTNCVNYQEEKIKIRWVVVRDDSELNVYLIRSLINIKHIHTLTTKML